MKIMLDIETEKNRISSLKYRENKKLNGILIEYNPLPVIVIYDLIMCLNFGDLNYHLKRIHNHENVQKIVGLYI
jgi:uncharacterized protein YkvS